MSVRQPTGGLYQMERLCVGVHRVYVDFREIWNVTLFTSEAEYVALVDSVKGGVLCYLVGWWCHIFLFSRTTKVLVNSHRICCRTQNLNTSTLFVVVFERWPTNIPYEYQHVVTLTKDSRSAFLDDFKWLVEFWLGRSPTSVGMYYVYVCVCIN